MYFTSTVQAGDGGEALDFTRLMRRWCSGRWMLVSSVLTMGEFPQRRNLVLKRGQILADYKWQLNLSELSFSLSR